MFVHCIDYISSDKTSLQIVQTTAIKITRQKKHTVYRGEPHDRLPNLKTSTTPGVFDNGLLHSTFYFSL